MILLQQTFKTNRHARKFHHAAKGRPQGGYCRSIRDNGWQESEYYTRDELCARLHITYTTLWRMEKRGDIQAYKIGRRNLYSKQEVDALISNGLSANTNNQ